MRSLKLHVLSFLTVTDFFSYGGGHFFGLSAFFFFETAIYCLQEDIFLACRPFFNELGLFLEPSAIFLQPL
jgi:hypothetical protein